MLGLKLVELFGKKSRGVAVLEEVCHWALRSQKLQCPVNLFAVMLPTEIVMD